MSSLKPITLYSHGGGPNPWKVAILLEELQIPYKSEFMDLSKLQEKPFKDINVNGRVPAIVDPNTGLTLWESGAIMEYLQETYDKENKLHAGGLDKFLVKQWLYFQMSGQGPYFGQAVWFQNFHPEKNITSAIDRYRDIVFKVFNTLNTHLEGKTYLVGEKCTIADLSFLPWDHMLSRVLGDKYNAAEIEKSYPNYVAWNKRLNARPAVKKALADKDAAIAAGH